jgi:DNA polymerase (family 10)
MEIPTVGRSIAEKVHEYLQSGGIEELEILRTQIPEGVRLLMSIPGVGPKKAMVLYEELGIHDAGELRDAIADHKLALLKGFGEKTEQNILKGLEMMASSGGRSLLGAALDLAESLIGELSGLKEVARITYAGSLRRMCETIGDIDLLVAGYDSEPMMDLFVSLPLVAQVLAHGETKSSIVTSSGIQVDLRVVQPAVWGAALQYFTGSKAHNVKVREMAVRKGLKLSEYGLFEAKSGKLIVAETEEEVYERLGLPWIPATMREDRGEVAAALRGELPGVLMSEQLRGDLHTHTDLTDGLGSLEDMLATARDMNYSYYAVTDHAPDLAMHRMTDAKMLTQRKRIAALRKEEPHMTILHGSELNIGPTGDVDWGEDFLSGFDITIASIHSHFRQSKEDMTRRLVSAMENPYVNVIGHPTGRLIGKREPVDFDFDEVFTAAARTGTAMEINAHPDRLDLRDEHILWARRRGVKFAINTDAHSTINLGYMHFGVATAQRGWLTQDDVINAWPLAKLQRFLRKGR